MFDTHCHLNFKSFDGKVEEIVDRSRQAGVDLIVVPGTDFETSKKAVEISTKYQEVYAAVGIHPHHIFEALLGGNEAKIGEKLSEIESLLGQKKVIAVGEVGLDRHIYSKTKYENYRVEEEFITLQKKFLEKQIGLAIKYKKSLILHNREAKGDMIGLLNQSWDKYLEGLSVFHCCEPDSDLLDFAVKHDMFVGIDGDVFYRKDKQEFILKIPPDRLVLETDSPFLSPTKQFPNMPENIDKIAEFIGGILNKSKEEIGKITTDNAKRLFNLK